MRILFVASGNDKYFKIAPFVESQAESLRANGIEVDYFLIQKKGLRGYLQNIFKLRRYLKENKYDILHAHYNLCGWISVLALPKTPIILSLMGDDAFGTYVGYKRLDYLTLYLPFLTWLIQPFVNRIISKSANIEKFVYRKKISFIIPNGIKIESFVFSKTECRNQLGLKADKKYILFLGDKKNLRKNFRLAQSAISLMSDDNIELISPYPVQYEEIAKYLNAADVFLLTSYAEGSPNVIKEAMACNCPIVATDVGDVRWLLGDLEGHYITSFRPEDVAKKIKLALQFSYSFGKTKGKKRLIALGLDAQTVSKRIIEVYKA